MLNVRGFVSFRALLTEGATQAVAIGVPVTTMKLTWTFYPKGQPGITLTVVYVPQLDSLAQAGYLEVDTNTAYVSWSSFRTFDTGDQAAKKALFGALVRIDQFDPRVPIVA